MGIYKRIFLIWGVIEVCTVLSIVVLPHIELSLIRETSRAFDLFFAILCFQLGKKETNKGNKSIFFTFSLYPLALSIGGYLSLFVGKAFFSDEPYSKIYFYQYSTATYDFLLGLSVANAVFSAIFRKYKTYQIYVFSLITVGIVFIYLNHPIFLDAKYIYKTEETLDFIAVRNASIQWKEENKSDPSIETLVSLVDLRGIPKQTMSEQVYREKKLERVSELSTYLKGRNYIIVLVKPLLMNTIIVNLFCVLLLSIYCFYRYSYDPPQSAYLDKIILLFIPYCSVEILHAYWFVSSADFFEFVQTFDLGLLISRCIELPIFVLIILRLNFISSPVGAFYEQKIQENPTQVSRWRDVFDRLITRHFFDRDNLRRRVFAAPRSEESI